MVVGHVEEEVVSNMGAYVVVNVIDKPIVAVNGRKCPFEKIPVFAAIPGNIRFRVVQKGNQVKPDDKNHIGAEIIFQQKQPAELIRQQAQKADHQSPEDSADDNIPLFRRSKKWATWEKVRASIPLRRPS